MLRQFFSVFALLLFACNGESQNQNTKVDGPCEGCEAIYEYGNNG
jgi:protocatechuate 3,4-dioxygenase beta subunit